ncbi:DUF262 domain-containing HNH endonuclease family protein [Cellulophaga sp. BC115SP]|uniref:DUF262 domain-containing protein n=1 Tax=Cellulophaga sp. BC115SP TaxID=2683263 RepID=UPI0014123B74|nr:DUF262 domain-containing HNH endonuclease family protein [Cellulophaga sp. BC115SP]NBB29943.1 DUF262 domain-containing protein [Cellulophaga sp. BC115SP]
MINIEKAFVTENRSVFDFFQQPGLGFYIPLYQREYSWDTDNIEQLLEDISKGIERLVDEKDENEVRFLGTIITVGEVNKNNIQPQDTQALPVKIDKLIDGQQRLSTIAIFATLLYKHITLVSQKIVKDEPLKNEIEEACQSWFDRLVKVFSLDLGRGTPKLKPKIIRGQKDRWTRDGEINANYLSPVANYLASVIDAIHFKKNFEKPNQKFLGANLVKNIRLIDNWLDKSIRQAHVNQNEEFSPAWHILNNINQENIWLYDRPNLQEKVNEKETLNRKNLNYILCELVQLFSVCHYLTDRCCFTIIQPSNDDWAFDMFQSLNATGTPLTAIETFKPLVVQTTEKRQIAFKESTNQKNFQKVEDLFSASISAAQKSKLTNDYLTSFAIAFNGSKLSSHFSHQRKWLDDKFKDFDQNQGEEEAFEEKAKFIAFLGDYAEFYKQVWIDYDGRNSQVIPKISSSPEADLASLLLKYLHSSNHKMSITILGRFYKSVINQEENAVENFVQAVKTIAAFYSLWRGSKSNTGLDNVYRKFFKDRVTPFESIQIQELKEFLRNELGETKETWVTKAVIEMKYNKAESVCRLALFISSHDTIPDTETVGLMKIGARGCSNYLNLQKWFSSDLSTIEHIAPQNGEDIWDNALYELDSELYQSIGNLTLLPTKINSSLGNRGWLEKFIYFKHLSEKDPEKLQRLSDKANALGINLRQNTIDLLMNSNYNDHIASIVTLTETGSWNHSLVEKRAKRILEIFWNRISPWLYS